MVDNQARCGAWRRRLAIVVVLTLTSLLVALVPPPAGAAEVPALAPPTTAGVVETPVATAAAPVVTSVSPTKGLAVGGTTVTVTGIGFTGATGVRFGGTAATAFTVVSDTTITAMTPPPTAAPNPTTTVNVFVDTPSGTNTNALPSWYRYVAPPTILSMTPSSGSFEGGQDVTLTFTDPGAGSTGVSVRIGGASPPWTGSNSAIPGTIHFPTPPGTAGTADVVLTGIGGPSAPVAFTYLTTPRPDVYGVSPSTGPIVGGTSVTILGDNLTGATDVSFGTYPAQSVPFTVVSDASITTVAPATTSSGHVGVVVTTPAGPSTTPGVYHFEYLGPPEIGSLTPSQGGTGGGTTVVIAGKDLDDVTAVRFGTVAATSWSYSATFRQITAVAPAHAAGGVVIRLDSSAGQSDDRPAATFTYSSSPAPAIVQVTPRNGPRDGGRTVTITGTGFTGTTAVRFGGVGSVGGPAASFTVVSDTRIDAVTAASNESGTVNVFVDNPSGTSPPSLATWYMFLTPPSVSSVSPTVGATIGGQVVSITGSSFDAIDGVRFGAVAATSVVQTSPSTVTAVVPTQAAGQVRVQVHSPTRGWSTYGPLYTYVTPMVPTVTALSPPGGPAAGGTTVTITGTGLGATTAVRFGSTTPATSFTIVSDTRIDAVAPPAPAPVAPTLTANVFVDTTAGTNANLARSWYRWSSVAPAVTGVAPAQGPKAGGTSVAVTGSGFQFVTAVRFGGTPATSFTVQSTGTLTAVAPSGAAGTVDVQVVAWGGTSVTNAAARFTRVTTTAPSVSSLSHDLGPTAGGQTVDVYGQAFGTVTSVTLGGIAATSVTIHSDTHLTVVTPPRAADLVNLRATNPWGQSGVSTGSTTYRYAPAPALTAITPPQGSAEGGTTADIIGTDLWRLSTVSFGGVPTTNFFVLDATRVRVWVPPGALGTATVTVTNPLGTSAPSPGATYTYVDVPSPVVSTLSPTTGPLAGGTTVTVTGSGFTGATGVFFGGTTVPATSFTVLSDTQISAVTPERPYAFAVHVQVQALGGQNIIGGQTFQYAG